MTEQQEKDKLIDRIMKMYRKYQSLMAMGSEAEAMAFLEGVQKTLQAHNLEMSEVEYQTHQKEQPIKMHSVSVGGMEQFKRRAKLVPWQRVVIDACAQAHFCRVIFIKKSNEFLLIGRREDRMVGEFMILTLLEFAEVAADKAYVKAFYALRAKGMLEAARGFRKNFITAFAQRICQRYEDLIKEMEAKSKAAGSGNALVRLGGEMALVKMAAEEIGKAMGTNKVPNKVGDHDFNLLGALEGRKAADKVNLKGTALTGGEPGPQRLREGQKLIGG